MKIGDIYYEKHTVTKISPRTNTVSETQVEKVNAIPIAELEVREMKKVWLVVTSFNDIPRVLGVYSTKEKAEKIAYTQKFWCNVIEKEVE